MKFKKDAKDALWGKWGEAITGLLITYILAVIIGFAIGIAMVYLIISGVVTTLGGIILYLLIMLLYVLVVLLLNLILIGIYMFIYDNKKLNDSFVARVIKVFPKAIVLNFLNGLSILLGSLLIIPGIINAYKYSMCNYILMDNPYLSVFEIREESRRMMHGEKLDLFFLELSFIGWVLLIPLTFGLASFYVVPYMQTTIISFYKDKSKIKQARYSSEIDEQNIIARGDYKQNRKDNFPQKGFNNPFR
ncbi:MAG: DUF975 family protein [Bacilli bacterium]|nr:DUF975 family protein [Bacilli bacterium]